MEVTTTKQNKVIFIMGVSGAGKSTIGTLLSRELDLPCFDGDDYHPPKNVAKMTSGQALTDRDRIPWLRRLNALAREQLTNNSCIILCSALRESYRSVLMEGIRYQSCWIYLRGTYDQILKRLQSRQNHFMPAALLRSQFDTLEEPDYAYTVGIHHSEKEIVEMIKHNVMMASEFGVIGLGVMGKSISRNLAQKGFKLSLFNRHLECVEEKVAERFTARFPELRHARAFDKLEGFVQSLERPRKILLMVNAGKATDQVIEDLKPFLSAGDIIIDGGNSHFLDTERRMQSMGEMSVEFIGAGISGGEEGALHGPSIMPGGERVAYDGVKPYLETIAAKDKQGHACCAYIGTGGSGHFVKMVHNGMEYVEMQLLAEVYDLLRAAGHTLDDIAGTLDTWKETAGSYLLEITVDILRKRENGEPVLDYILDKAGNKGTGNWATISAARLGTPNTLIPRALFARYSSYHKEERNRLEALYGRNMGDGPDMTADELLGAYRFARLINHYQGFKLLSTASEEHRWGLNLSEIARIWTNGCIIRSSLMEDLVDRIHSEPNLMTEPSISDQLQSNINMLKKVVIHSAKHEVSIPCLSESLQFFLAMTTADSTANLIQAQRDYFGAHTYQRTGDSSGTYYHTDWKK